LLELLLPGIPHHRGADQAPLGFTSWYWTAAERDEEAARRNRELLFPNGIEVTQDAGEALRWSRAAAEQGIADAQANTGLIYSRGIGCERDFNEARHWYQLAAEQGSAAAELGLGILYANGPASWYGRAAQQGNASAQAALGLMYLCGQGVDRDPSKAAEWFAGAAEQARAVQPGAAHPRRQRPAAR
jgi:TPR repeat protein